jgi:poly-gamma-glutamate synthesis protein (capsule biosynthesis protein)
LPNELSDSLQETTSITNRPVEVVTAKWLADVRIEPWAEVPLTDWIFALVAPFPTLEDGMSSQDLESVWRGKSSESKRIYLPEEYMLPIEAFFDGKPAQDATIVGADELLEQAWLDPKAIAILPFQYLDPRWKVLEVDGISPIRKDFQQESYPLKVSYGLSGEPADIAVLADSLGWQVSNRDPDQLTTLVMTGVTALARATAWTMEQKGIEYPAEKIGQWLLDADITHISNEVSFLDTCPAPTPVREGLIFCSDPDYIKLLESIDVDVIELTGNHLNDYGTDGFLMTLELYRERAWGTYGGGNNLEEAFQPLLMEHNGNKLAFLGCNSVGPYSVLAKEASPGAAPCDYERLYPELERLRLEGYLSIFTFQWNEYYQAIPNSKQRQDFRAAVDAGAVIVSGSQAHQPQAMEFYGDAFIHYGLGNLFFDQMWGIQVRQEFLDRHVIYNGRHISTELLTAFLEDFAQPRPMTTEERKYFLQGIFEASGW